MKFNLEKFLHLYKTDMAMKEIIKELGMSTAGFYKQYNKLIKNGIIQKKSYKKNIDTDYLVAMYQNNVKIADISEKLKLSDRTINDRIKELIQQGVIKKRKPIIGDNRKKIDYNYIDKFRNLGISMKILAKEMGVNIKTMHSTVKHMEKMGYDTSKYFTTNINVPSLVKLYLANISYEFMAIKLGAAQPTIRRVIEILINNGTIQRRDINRRLDFDKNEFIEAYNHANSIQELSEQYFCSTNIILKYAKQYGLPLKKPRTPQSRLSKRKFIYYYNNNLKYDRIAMLLNVHPTTIARYARKLQKEGVLEPRQKTVKWPSDEVFRQQYLDANRSHWKLANIYEVSQTTITRKLRSLWLEGQLPEYNTPIDKSDNLFIQRQAIFFGL